MKYNILEKDLPCIYGISWSEKDLEIIFRLHKNAALAAVYLCESPLTEYLKDNLGLSEFDSDINSDFGFSKCFRKIGTNGGFLEFAVKIPRVKKITEEKCSACEGSGKTFDTKCFRCNGTGKKSIMVFDDLKAILATFMVVTNCFSKQVVGSVDNPNSSQLITLDLRIYETFGGNRIYANISKYLREWLDCFTEDTSLSGIIRAMKTAYGHMMGHIPDDYDGFRALIRRSGGIVIDCPGDSAGLDPETDMILHPGKGYSLIPHNIETYVQVITLMVGLAALCDMTNRKNNTA